MVQWYVCFYNNFLRNSDNGRSSLRITNTFSLEVTSIKLKSIGNDIRLHLKSKIVCAVVGYILA
jgi:hypothetical protein